MLSYEYARPCKYRRAVHGLFENMVQKALCPLPTTTTPWPMTTRGPSLVVTLHYLGPPGTYSHQVAQQISQRLYLNKIKSSPPSTSAPEGRDFLIDLKPCETIKQTLKAAQSSLTDLENVSLALLPYENNTNGPVAESFDIVRRDVGFRIVADDFLPVSHSLLVSRRAFDVLHKESNCGKSDQIESNARNSRLEVMSRLKAVCSHPQVRVFVGYVRFLLSFL